MALRNPEKSDLDTLNVSNISETRREEEAPSTPEHIDPIGEPAARYTFKWNEDNIDGSRAEATNIHKNRRKRKVSLL